MDEDYDKAWESYLKLCRLSASGFFTDMLKEVGLQSPFEDGCIKKCYRQAGRADGEVEPGCTEMQRGNRGKSSASLCLRGIRKVDVC